MDSTYSADELGQYRSLSTLSVVALLLGLLSPLVLVSPLLMFFPLAAAAAAGLALLKIRAADGNLSGKILARWGLALAIVFGVGAIARAKIGEFLYRQQISAVVEPWLTRLTEDRYDEALNLMSPEAIAKLRRETSLLGGVSFFERRLTAEQLAKEAFVQSLGTMASPAWFPELVTMKFAALDTYVTSVLKTKRANCVYEVTSSRGERLQLGIQLTWLPPTTYAPATYAPATYAPATYARGWRIDQWQLIQP